jgi:pimeloyl-ACP methyl ester carboxylesterase
MEQFRRAVRFLLIVVGGIAGIFTTILLFFTRFIIRPPRQKLWATPADYGIGYQDVHFPARDGVRLSAWFMPAKNTPKATIIMLHGWGWCRLGTHADNPLDNFPGSPSLELFPLATALHNAGYNLLLPDMRNHGQSAAAAAVTFGWHEASDLLGSVDYLRGNAETSDLPIHTIGFSMGANATLFALPQTDQISKAILVQPTTPQIFVKRYASYLLGSLGGVVALAMRVGYPILSGGMKMSAIDPVFATSGAKNTSLLFVQSEGDRWGSPHDVARMVAAAPHTETPVWVTGQRFDGYGYLVAHPDIVINFLNTTDS